MDRGRRKGLHHQARETIRCPCSRQGRAERRTTLARFSGTNGQACQGCQHRSNRLRQGKFLKTYFDTGVLVKVYLQEQNSADAIELLSRVGPPIPFTHLHTLELLTAIRLKRFRKEISPGEERTAIGMVNADLVSKRLQLPNYDLIQVFHRAEGLSARYAAAVGTRTLDILHVAAALEARCNEFVSFDERQRKVAAKARLLVLPRELPLREVARQR